MSVQTYRRGKYHIINNLVAYNVRGCDGVAQVYQLLDLRKLTQIGNSGVWGICLYFDETYSKIGGEIVTVL